jgi:hypothetical protein
VLFSDCAERGEFSDDHECEPCPSFA